MNIGFFATLAEQNRFDIVELLYKNPYTVNEIVARLNLNQPQVSKHLKVLADAGIVTVHPIKNKRVYSLKPKPFKELDTWLSKYRDMWQERLDRLDNVLRKGVNKND